MKNMNAFNILIFTLGAILFGFSSCDKEENEILTESAVNLELSKAVIGVNGTLELTPFFGKVQRPVKSYHWTSSDTTILRVATEPGSYKGILTAVSEGVATATISSDDGILSAQCEISATELKETAVSIPENIIAYTQAETVVVPDFIGVDLPARTYTWTSEPNDALTINFDPQNYQATIQGNYPGTATLTIRSSDGTLMDQATVEILDENDGILKILAIGNSFSEDALETHLHGIAEAAGKEIVIGNMYMPGAELALHADNATNNNATYSYRKIELNGDKTTTADVSIATAVQDENWDYISFQQASPKSGQYETFVEPLPVLYEIVKDLVGNDYTKYLLHRTWAYAPHSTHSGFANYNNDQLTMYEAIVDAYNQAKDLIPTYDIIPAGTGIQNGRTSYLQSNFTRDGYHLNDLGKYIASCVWFEKLFGESVLGNSYEPEGIIDFNIDLAQNAAHFAVQTPDEITELENFKETGGSGILTADVFIDFSTSSASPGWNGMTGFLEGSSIPNLLYTNNDFTGVTATITKRFNGASNTGVAETNTALNMPQDVARTFFYGNAGAAWGGLMIDTSAMVLSGFKSDGTYDLCFFSSRSSVSDNRESKFIVNGETTQSSTVNSSANAEVLVCISNVQPDENGEIEIVFTAGENNNNGNKFFYVSAMRISPN